MKGGRLGGLRRSNQEFYASVAGLGSYSAKNEYPDKWLLPGSVRIRYRAWA